MDNEFIQIFKRVINRHGYDVCNNYRLLNSFLADYAEGEYNKERKLLVWVLETNCHKTLSAQKEYIDWKNEWTIKLNTEEFIDKQAALWALDTIFKVLFGEPYYIERGFLFLKSNNIHKAELSFNSALELERKSSGAFHGKGLIALNEKKKTPKRLKIDLFSFILEGFTGVYGPIV